MFTLDTIVYKWVLNYKINDHIFLLN